MLIECLLFFVRHFLRLTHSFNVILIRNKLNKYLKMYMSSTVATQIIANELNVERH